VLLVLFVLFVRLVVGGRAEAIGAGVADHAHPTAAACRMEPGLSDLAMEVVVVEPAVEIALVRVGDRVGDGGDLTVDPLVDRP
jgi:hypothetical protein